jgi:hypothetical protein
MSTTQQKDPFALKPGCCVEPGTDKNHPAIKVHRDYQPLDSHPYYVTDDDNWLALTNNNLQAARKLIKFNFNTNHEPYVNWYLRHYVGCTRRTLDHKNYRFSTNDRHTGVSKRAGIVFFPNDPIFGDDTHAAPIGYNPQNLRFQSHFFADSLLADEIEAIAALAKGAVIGGATHQMEKKLADWLKTTLKWTGEIGSNILSAIGAIYKCYGVLLCDVVDADGSLYAWTFRGYLVGKDIPFTGDGPQYSTNFSEKVCYNLNVLEPRVEWNGKEISFTFSRTSAAIRVHRALWKRISPDYQPFPTYQTPNTDMTISMPLIVKGPLGLATTPPGLWMTLKPFGRLADLSASQLVLKIISKDFEF